MKKKAILLVEDEVLIALMEKKWLLMEGFDVIHCTSAEEAIEIVQSDYELIDMILMDIDLGSGIDGTQAANIILQNYDIPLLFLSSHTEPDLVKKTEEISSYGYIVKGSSDTVLLASIRMAFRLYDAKRKLRESEKNLRQIIDNMGEGLAFVDQSEIFTFANPKGESIFGVGPGELIGKSLSEFHDEQEFEKVLFESKQRVKGLSSVFESVIKLYNGQRKVIQVTATPRISDKGEYLGTLGIFREVT